MPIDTNWFPARLRPHAMRLRAWLASDAVVLVILAISLVTRGVSYLPAPGQGPRSHPAENLFSIHTWAIIWITAGIACLIAALWQASYIAAIAYAAGVGLHAVWAGSFLLATMTGEFPRGWVAATGYLLLVVFSLWAPWALGATRRMVTQAYMPSGKEVADELRR